MANPTTYYKWRVPQENQNPWFETVNSAFNAIDTTVSSIARLALPRVTVVISDGGAVFGPSVSSPFYSLHGADGAWEILSHAPFGRLVGSFALVFSGSQVLINFRPGQAYTIG